MINTLRVLTRPWPLVTVWSPRLPCLSMTHPRWELGAPRHQASRDVTCRTFNIVKLEEYLLSLYIFNDNTDPLCSQENTRKSAVALFERLPMEKKQICILSAGLPQLPFPIRPLNGIQYFHSHSLFMAFICEKLNKMAFMGIIHTKSHSQGQLQSAKRKHSGQLRQMATTILQARATRFEQG